MSKYDNDYYYQKYLKYKNKYMELKEYEGGGWLIPDSGIYIYFCNNQYVDKICKAINEKTISSSNINKILYDKGNNIVFKGKHGSNELTQITKSTSESIKDTAALIASKTAEGTKFLASKAAEGTSSLASKTAEGTKFLASKAASKAASGARTVMDRNKDINTIVLPSTTGGGEGGGKVKVIKLTDNDKNPIKLDIAKINDLKNVVMYLRTNYNPNIDSIVIITYSPMGKNICNQKITWTDEELEQKSGINMDLTDTPASLARVDTYTGPLLQDNNPLSLKRAQTLKPFPPDKPQLQRKKTM